VHIHGTTVATNAILEGKGAVTACLTTVGHEDALEIGRQKRSRMYDLNLDPETPGFLVPRYLRAGIPERIDGQGKIILPLDEDAVRRAVNHFKEHHNVQSIAVCYLNSYRNPTHEKKTLELIKALFPNLAVSLSSEINPVFREYERTCVTVFDAYIRPVVEDYIAKLGARLASGPVEQSRDLRIMQSRGGITTAKIAASQPICMILSGPAGGVVGAKYSASLSNRHDLITMDIGGTSCDVSLVQAGKVELTKDGRVRGYPLRFPMVDITTIGSGGGSIAWIDSAGGLHVGPQSAGSTPGPACYGNGGLEPTATDASVLLGYMNPASFAAGTLPLYPDNASAVIQQLADRMMLSREEMALGIHRILNAQMVEAIKLITVRRGYDPRKFSLVAFGGAGAIHAGEVARQLGIREVIVPANPGTLSAYGMLAADIEVDGVASYLNRTSKIDPKELDRRFSELSQTGHRRLLADGVPGEPISERRLVDMRYRGQSYELEIPFPVLTGNVEHSLSLAVGAFHLQHEQVYGHANPTREVELVSIRVVHYQNLGRPKVSKPSEANPKQESLLSRRAYFYKVGWQDTPVVLRHSLVPGERLTGPAIIEQHDTTIVVYPGQYAVVDAAGNLMIRITTDDAAAIDGKIEK
jgi:N-methylhydantoinase A